MMVGIPSSGKSFIREKIAREENAIILSSDIVREKLHMDPSKEDENIRLFDLMYEMIREELSKGNNVLLDSTNTYRKYRRPFLQSLNKDVEVIGVMMMRQIENCLAANRNRNNRIEEYVIRNMYEEYDLPLYEDGFDRFEVIYPDDDEYSLQAVEKDRENVMAYRSMFLDNGLSGIEKLHLAQKKLKDHDLNR